MTNVPDNIREMWADIYKLFDINYKMENTEEAWNMFWQQAQEIGKKYNTPSHFISMVGVAADMIADRMKQDANHHPCTYEDMNLF